MIEMPRSRWLSISTAVNFSFWAVAVFHEWIVRGPFIDLGGDWARFWGAAHAFDRVGPGAGYQLSQIARYMQPLARFANPSVGGVRPGPAPYPPVFLKVFELFAAPAPLLGFILWTAFNAALALLVARRLARRFPTDAQWPVTLALFSFFPLMLDLFSGQVVVLLLVCLMAAVSDFEHGHELRAGIWTGLLILKPQYAAILVLVFLLKRRTAAVAGFAIGTAAILLGSVAVGGISGVIAYARMLVTAYPSYTGTTGIDPRGMIGWRGFVATGLPFLGSIPSLFLVVVLTAATVAVLPFIWRGPWDPASPRFARQLTATIAVTLLTAYHSQPHGAALILVPGAIVVARADATKMTRRLLIGIAAGGPVVGFISAIAFGTLWLVGPAASAALAAVIAALAYAEHRGPSPHAETAPARADRDARSTRTSANRRPSLGTG
jgi:hypothetical protein